MFVDIPRAVWSKTTLSFVRLLCCYVISSKHWMVLVLLCVTVRSWVPRYICWTSACCCEVAMATSLTGVGILWAFLSLAAALLCCSGFYLPFWIQVCHNYTQVTCRYRMYKIQFPTHFKGGIGSIPRVDKLPRGTTFFHSSLASKITHLGWYRSFISE